MQLFSSENPDWDEIPADGESDTRSRLDTRLRQLLGAERLIVLTGLGTSRCITDASGGLLAPSMADLWRESKDAAGEDAWAHALAAAGWSSDFAEDIELLLSRCQMALTLQPDERLSTFVEVCEGAIVKACRFVTAGTDLPAHEAFLRRIARRPTRLPRTQLFTTNYDLAFETAASRTGFAIVDGFSHAAPQQFGTGYFDVDFAIRDRERAATPVEWMPSVLHLLKLHGSVDWVGTPAGVLRDPTAQRPLIVYPRTSKFEVSYQPPFLELMARFQAALRRPDTGLLIVGSGLSDRHLVEPVLSAIRSNVRLAMLMVSPGLSASPSTEVTALERYIVAGDRRLALLEARFEDLVPFLPDLVPETEAEQHLQRATS